MNPTQLSALLVELLSLPAETEWVEWKHNNDNPDMIAERISALANSAALRRRPPAMRNEDSHWDILASREKGPMPPMTWSLNETEHL